MTTTVERNVARSGALPPGLVVSAPSSGAGKTTIMLGLVRALKNRGLIPQSFKCGPDYIDPAFHRASSGRPSYNLDSWSMSAAMISGLVDHAAGADVILAEGAMGLFDGVAKRGAVGNGASADIAALMHWPVILVIDCTAQAQTAAAVASGLARYRSDVAVGGVILNKVAGERHFALVRDGFEGTGLDILGWLPRQSEISMPERHLGLVQAEENTDLELAIARAATLVENHVDIDRLLQVVGPTNLAAGGLGDQQRPQLRPPGQRIALARDEAFSFTYPHMLDAWRAAGAEIHCFSPLANEAPDASADVVWLPGGYPELHAGRIAAATRFLDGLRTIAQTRPVHGECGGYMVLGEQLIDADGRAHAMAGLLGLVTSFEKRRLHLGYRAAKLREGMAGYAPGTRLRGHEFHYSSVLEQSDAPLADVVDASGVSIAEQGSRRGLTTGTFFHLVAEDCEGTA